MIIKYFKSKDKQGEGYILSVFRPFKALFYGYDNNDDRLAKWAVLKIGFKVDDKDFLKANKELLDDGLLVEIQKSEFDTLKLDTDGYKFIQSSQSFIKELEYNSIKAKADFESLSLSLAGKEYDLSLNDILKLNIIAKGNVKLPAKDGSINDIAIKDITSEASKQVLKLESEKGETLASVATADIEDIQFNNLPDDLEDMYPTDGTSFLNLEISGAQYNSLANCHFFNEDGVQYDIKDAKAIGLNEASFTLYIGSDEYPVKATANHDCILNRTLDQAFKKKYTTNKTSNEFVISLGLTPLKIDLEFPKGLALKSIKLGAQFESHGTKTIKVNGKSIKLASKMEYKEIIL